MDPNTLAQRNEQLKRSLRLDLDEDLKGIYAERNPPVHTQEVTRKAADTSEHMTYFELVYECVHTRYNYINVVTVDRRNPVEPDIDLAILRALLNGNRNTGDEIRVRCVSHF